jgi:hypothetical protein
MKVLKHMMTAALMLGLCTVGVFADEQKNNQPKPPKEPKVVERPQKPPPPRNENRGGNSGRGNDNRRERPF